MVGEADAEIHLVVTDGGIDALRMRPGADELAYVDPYSPDYRPSAVFLLLPDTAARRRDGS